jgi:putative modified peptide
MSFHLPAPIIENLLYKLGHDDDFRAEFTVDPRAALASLGFLPAASPSATQGIWNCLKVDVLAPKAVIRASSGAMRRMLGQTVSVFYPFVIGTRLDQIKSSA